MEEKAGIPKPNLKPISTFYLSILTRSVKLLILNSVLDLAYVSIPQFSPAYFCHHCLHRKLTTVHVLSTASRFI